MKIRADKDLSGETLIPASLLLDGYPKSALLFFKEMFDEK